MESAIDVTNWHSKEGGEEEKMTDDEEVETWYEEYEHEGEEEEAEAGANEVGVLCIYRCWVSIFRSLLYTF